jgi:hypothetical protein
MSEFQVYAANGSLDGSCFGLWEMSAPECGKCLVREHCEAKVKRGAVTQAEASEPIELTEEERKMPEIPPLEYMLDLLRSRFDYTTKQNDKAVAHCFWKDTEVVFTVIVAKGSGKLKLMLESGRTKILNGLDSIEQVEGVLKEMLG